ncbi:hypothetical protein Tco_1223639 [Tanacetum coccineum]
MRPFGCPFTILNTLDHLGKFDGKADEGFLVGYFMNSKTFRVFNSKTRKAEENLHSVQEIELMVPMFLQILRRMSPHLKMILERRMKLRIQQRSSSFTTVDPGRAKEQRNEYESLFDPLMPDLEDTANLQDTGIFGSAYDDEYVGAEADLSNLETNMSVSPIPTTKNS